MIHCNLQGNVLKLSWTFKIGLAGGINVDSAGKREQVILIDKLGERLVYPTFFEIEGWKRMKFFQKALEIFGFDPDSTKLSLEKVALPISIGNEQIYNAIDWQYQSHTKTFFVRKMNQFILLCQTLYKIYI